MAYIIIYDPNEITSAKSLFVTNRLLITNIHMRMHTDCY